MKKLSIVVVDYGCGNIHSATKALELAVNESNINGSVVLTRDPEKIIQADKLILPGVGAFESCIKKLKKIDGLKESLDEAALKLAKPILGICIGLQLMSTMSFEGGKHKGLNWIEGDVIPLDPGNNILKVPHMGWNEINIERSHPVFTKLEDKDFYFVHSFRFSPKSSESVISSTNYGNNFASSLGKDNILGTQFHPEKSQGAGVAFLKNFIKWSP